ncbi:MAG: glycosyltransferase [Candidatus Marinimicrobia bacterium]|nr:glycosyltransferase [Candidatus Neomarinimicrobiota bacterium]
MPASRTHLPPDLSIVIPVLNEADKILQDIQSAAEFCHGQGIVAEIVVSDDGSSDGSVEAAERGRAGLPEGISLVVLTSDEHYGKGYAVRKGMLAAQGTVVMFADSGGNIAWKFILGARALIAGGACQIVHGSRKLPDSNILARQPLPRRILSFLFQRFARLILPIPGQLTDTQCGFKFYSREVAQTLFQECALNGFLFDLDIILMARQRGFTIREIPVDWRCDRDSRLRLRDNIYQMAKELGILYNLYGGRGKNRLHRHK